jgi:hypothetical protein
VGARVTDQGEDEEGGGRGGEGNLRSFPSEILRCWGSRLFSSDAAPILPPARSVPAFSVTARTCTAILCNSCGGTFAT